MQDDEILAYVKSAARLQGVPLTEERALAVAAHFARTIAIAGVLEGAPLALEDEPAEVYSPAPFPEEDA